MKMTDFLIGWENEEMVTKKQGFFNAFQIPPVSRLEIKGFLKETDKITTVKLRRSFFFP